MNRTALQSKQVGVTRMAFRARKVFGTFEPLNRDSNPDLCDIGAVLHQLSYQAYWQLVAGWVDHMSLDELA